MKSEKRHEFHGLLSNYPIREMREFRGIFFASSSSKQME